MLLQHLPLRAHSEMSTAEAHKGLSCWSLTLCLDVRDSAALSYRCREHSGYAVTIPPLPCGTLWPHSYHKTTTVHGRTKNTTVGETSNRPRNWWGNDCPSHFLHLSFKEPRPEPSQVILTPSMSGNNLLYFMEEKMVGLNFTSLQR